MSDSALTNTENGKNVRFRESRITENVIVLQPQKFTAGCFTHVDWGPLCNHFVWKHILSRGSFNTRHTEPSSKIAHHREPRDQLK